jgi:hypothetical protein
VTTEAKIPDVEGVERQPTRSEPVTKIGVVDCAGAHIATPEIRRMRPIAVSDAFLNVLIVAPLF